MLKEKMQNREKIIGTHINFCDSSVIRSAEEADRLLSCTLYPPYGKCVFGPMNAVGYGAYDTLKYVFENHNTMCGFIQIEHIDAVRNLDGIMKNQ